MASEWKVIVNILAVIGGIASLFAIIGGLYSFYSHFIKPKRPKTKLHKVYEMIREWFDEIDCNLEQGLNTAALNNTENKIRDYIENNLKKYELRFSTKFIRVWNRKRGLKKEFWDSIEEFHKSTGIHADEIYLDSLFQILVGKFYTFHSNYKEESKETNFGEVEAPVRLLKSYVEQL